MYAQLFRELTDLSPLASSFSEAAGTFSFHTVLLLVMAFFSAVGVIDKLRGNPHGYGAEFDKAFDTLPPVAVIMIGAIPLVPILNLIFRPVVTPLYTFFGASPAMFAGTLLPLDLGAWLLADLYYRRFMAKPDAARIS